MFRNLGLTFKVLDFRVMKKQQNLRATITFFFFPKVQTQASTFSLYIKVARRIFGFKISKSTQANFSNSIFSYVYIGY
jgi:hypothetical protein